ncbi:uncharacterized protein MYCFIDRAFT_172166 [Pseudocercospora fijiensis CIRAD86]|uniref:Uncharacterized protein n=1 Tax=Pseudocercospora fijiensis (strain CIRAD86) TaxID=383855 RepID=M2Z9C0_PSEFD|nr:uncharacterized protein MYCFIDRAFT_172166 [Pseudocercospora fijiensis CIRAD86]EME86410.1 hypothetical protein MYCFIDRAFT_172166 [Pseudocercospora fijiensis CIRAD86]
MFDRSGKGPREAMGMAPAPFGVIKEDIVGAFSRFHVDLYAGTQTSALCGRWEVLPADVGTGYAEEEQEDTKIKHVSELKGSLVATDFVVFYLLMISKNGIDLDLDKVSLPSLAAGVPTSEQAAKTGKP